MRNDEAVTVSAYIILGYLVLLTGLGIWHSRRVRSGEDFALAGRRLGVTVTAGTLVATWMGTGSLFGSPQFTVEHGMAAFFYPLGGVLGILVLARICSRSREIPAASSSNARPSSRVLASTERRFFSWNRWRS